MKGFMRLRKRIILLAVISMITCISVLGVLLHKENIVNAVVNDLSEYKNNYEDRISNYRIDSFNEEYNTYLDWLKNSIDNKYVEEGKRIKGLLDELEERIISENEEVYKEKYDEINLLNINELEEGMKEDINLRKSSIDEKERLSKYKEAIDELTILKEYILEAITETQNKKKEEADKQREEEKKLEEENKKSEVFNDESSNVSKSSQGNNNNNKARSASGGGQSVDEGSYVKNLKAASRTNQLVMVKGQGGSNVIVEFHKKDGNGVWNQVFSTSGYVGQNGITYNKREGDKKTPAGVYGFGTGFGVAQNPGANVAYRVVNDDDCWVDDPNSSHYNTWCSINSGDKDWNSAEHMIEFSEAYRYGIVIQYNTYEKVPGKGSGIFLHCKTRPTAGCVAIDANLMVTLLQQINSSALIIIVPNEGDLNNY